MLDDMVEVLSVRGIHEFRMDLGGKVTDDHKTWTWHGKGINVGEK